jgi:hypothetical protein
MNYRLAYAIAPGGRLFRFDERFFRLRRRRA